MAIIQNIFCIPYKRLANEGAISFVLPKYNQMISDSIKATKFAMLNKIMGFLFIINFGLKNKSFKVIIKKAIIIIACETVPHVEKSEFWSI